MFPPGSTVAASASRVGNVTVTQEELFDLSRCLLERVPVDDVPAGHPDELELVASALGARIL